jgi:hypothetical protein
MSEPILLSGARIRQLLEEVAAELDGASTQRIIVVVGGSRLAWSDLRDSTQDIDSIRKLDDELRRAAAEVAKRHGLGRAWLNDHATAFAPVTLREDTCDLLLEHPISVSSAYRGGTCSS